MTLRSFSAALGICVLSVLAAVALAVESTASAPEVQALMKQGQYAAALEQVDKLLASKPKDAQARFAKGIILSELNRPSEAITVYQKLIEDYPELPEPYNNLAVLYASQKQFDKARAALELAIRTHPAYSTAHENLGDIYAKLASQAYDKALQIDSDNMQAQQKLATIRDLMSYGTRGTQVPTSDKPSKPALQIAAAAPSKTPTPAASATHLPTPQPTPSSTPTPAKRVQEKAVDIKPETKKPEKPEAKPEPKPEIIAQVKPITAAASNAAAKAERNDTEEAVRRAALAWAKEWSSKDVKGYLAAYGPDFVPPKGQSRKEWEAERRDRINKPGPIEVEVLDLDISLEGERAVARFRQRYSSSSLKSSTGKTLVFTQRNGRWLIQQERIGR